MNSEKNGTYVVKLIKIYNCPKFEGSISKFEVRNVENVKIVNRVIMRIFNELRRATDGQTDGQYPSVKVGEG